LFRFLALFAFQQKKSAPLFPSASPFPPSNIRNIFERPPLPPIGVFGQICTFVLKFSFFSGKIPEGKRLFLMRPHFGPPLFFCSGIFWVFQHNLFRDASGRFFFIFFPRSTRPSPPWAGIFPKAPDRVLIRSPTRTFFFYSPPSFRASISFEFFVPFISPPVRSRGFFTVGRPLRPPLRL